MVSSREVDEETDMQNVWFFWVHKMKNFCRKTEKLILLWTPFPISKPWSFPGQLKIQRRKIMHEPSFGSVPFSPAIFFLPSSIIRRCYLSPLFSPSLFPSMMSRRAFSPGFRTISLNLLPLPYALYTLI